MAPLVYADQSAGALHLTLVEGGFDPAQFQVLDRARLSLGPAEVEAGIIGQSHYIAVRGGDAGAWGGGVAARGASVAGDGGGIGFAEVVACTPVEARRVHRVRKLPRLHGTLATRGLGGVADYRFRAFRRSTADARPLARRIEAAARHVARSRRGIGLTRRFPVGPDGAEAQTVICARSDGERLDVRTMHVYPNEHVSVFTHSVIRVI